MSPVLFVILCILITVGIVLLIWAIVEPRILKVQRDTITVNNPDTDDSSARIFLLSDLHAEFCFIPVDKVIELIRKEQSTRGLDAVVFAGDLCNNPLKYQKGANYLNRISIVCREIGLPFIGVNGNHDVELTNREIEACGFKNIGNANYYITSSTGSRIRFSGITDSGRLKRVWYDMPDNEADYDMHILVAHNPDQILHLKKELPQVMLSGHIHGGQVRTPFGIEFSVLRKDTLPKKKIIAGLYDISGVKVYISKGIGCVKFPFRFLARPEVNILDIRSKITE